MTKEFLFDYINRHRLAAVSSINKEDRPEGALVGIAVTRGLELIFDTVMTSRKYLNLTGNPEAAVVIGWNDETTIQYEGTARVLSGPDAESYREVYYGAFPDGRERAAAWPGLVHFVITPRWIRYSSFADPKTIEETRF